MEKVAIIILIILYAIQAAFAVDAQKQINELRKELHIIKDTKE